MGYNFVEMNLESIEKIASWEYEGAVKSIYVQPYFDSYNEATGEMRGPADCKGFAVYDDEFLVGLFEYYFYDKIMEIGLALNPDLVGQGLGQKFLEAGISFGLSNFNYREDYIKLTVNEANLPALKIYERAGFYRYGNDGQEIEMRLQR
ncbi:MAG: GNAT family N-acetyltransferase [Bacillota bacterium]